MNDRALPGAAGQTEASGMATGNFLTKVPGILYGGDYNPEQWPEAIWPEDVRLMREAGVNVVTLGVFAWARLEPRPGEYDFAWLDRIVDLLHAHGIALCLATATAAPPPWFSHRYPASLPVTATGTTLWPGSRQTYCPSNPDYRRAAVALTRRIATHYKDHPALALWHINNEYGCHVPACYCDVSAQAFRAWLQRRYGTLDALNAAWGTAFWSQHYTDWDEISPARATPTFLNPTQQLDFQRFSSDALLECFLLERAVLREITPDVPVTTNFMGFFRAADYWRWAAEEDVVSNDSYPDPADPAAPADAAMTHDLMRSLGGGRPWLLMEQAPSAVNWRPVNVPKAPGQMRLWSYQAVARGADAVMFFQWRAARSGAEKFHSGMVPHTGTADSRVWREVTALGAELQGLAAIAGSRVPARVAIVFGWPNWWALEGESKPSAAVTLLEQVRAYYRPLYRANVAVDFVPPGADLRGYALVLVPNLYLVDDAAVSALTRYVEGGGTLVMSFFSGIVDENDAVRLGGYPAPFRALLGLSVEEFAPLPPDTTVPVRRTDGAMHTATLWADPIRLEGAEALATYTAGPAAGRPALTRHRYSAGTAYYLGTRPDAALMDWLLAQVAPPLDAPAPAPADGVEIARRAGATQTFTFVLNHAAEARAVPVAAGGVDLLSGDACPDRITLEPFGVAIVAHPRPAAEATPDPHPAG